MVANTSIEWAHHTFNPWMGCTRVSLACDNCYAAVSTPARTLGIESGPHAARRRTSASTWAQPRQWNREAERLGIRYRVFCASLADVFDNAVPEAWRRDLWALIGETPNLDWLLLTKRIGNAVDMLPMSHLRDGTWPNVWLGATVVTQAEADRDAPKLLATPATKRFLSMEPLLEAVDVRLLGRVHYRGGGDFYGEPMRAPLIDEQIDWIIVGGESGPGARPMHPEWARSLRDQCAAAGTPFLFKQWGEWRPAKITAGKDLGGEVRAGRVRILHPSGRDDDALFAATGRSSEPGSRYMERIGKRIAGRLLDGVQHDGVPE